MSELDDKDKEILRNCFVASSIGTYVIHQDQEDLVVAKSLKTRGYLSMRKVRQTGLYFVQLTDKGRVACRQIIADGEW